MKWQVRKGAGSGAYETSDGNYQLDLKTSGSWHNKRSDWGLTWFDRFNDTKVWLGNSRTKREAQEHAERHDAEQAVVRAERRAALYSS